MTVATALTILFTLSPSNAFFTKHEKELDKLCAVDWLNSTMPVVCAAYDDWSNVPDIHRHFFAAFLEKHAEELDQECSDGNWTEHTFTMCNDWAEYNY